MGCNILLISDDKEFAHQLSSKLIFLRAGDDVEYCLYDEVNSFFGLKNPDVVLVHENFSKQLSFDLIKNLRKNRDLCIIFLASNYDEQTILGAYDCGIDDFIMSSSADFEFVVRIVNNIKHHSVKLSGAFNTNLLNRLQIIDDTTGFYSYKYANLFELFDKFSVFIAISPSQAFKTQFLTEKFSNVLQTVLRSDDVVFKGKDDIFYLLLCRTDVNGAIVVINKIKENYGDNFELCASITEIKDYNFDVTEKKALQVLTNALATDAEYLISEFEEENSNEWLNDDKKEKNYKFFAQIFNKKFENVIVPVFDEIELCWRDKLYNTVFEQSVNLDGCTLHLENEKQESTLKIYYPGYSKIVVSIVHEGLDSPENDEKHLLLSRVNKQVLTDIVENFIEDFRSYGR